MNHQDCPNTPPTGGYEPPGHPDADAHETVQGPEELLYRRVSDHPLDHKDLMLTIVKIIMTMMICTLTLTLTPSFALFLCLVIKRLVGLISANAGLQVQLLLGRF